MTILYERMARKALELIEQRGQGMLVRCTHRWLDPVSGVASLHEQDFPAKGVVLNVESAQRTATSVAKRERTVMFAAGSFPRPPTTGDRLVIGSSVYPILAVETITPGGVDVVYKVRVAM